MRTPKTVGFTRVLVSFFSFLGFFASAALAASGTASNTGAVTVVAGVTSTAARSVTPREYTPRKKQASKNSLSKFLRFLATSSAEGHGECPSGGRTSEDRGPHETSGWNR